MREKKPSGKRTKIFTERPRRGKLSFAQEKVDEYVYELSTKMGQNLSLVYNTDKEALYYSQEKDFAFNEGQLPGVYDKLDKHVVRLAKAMGLNKHQRQELFRYVEESKRDLRKDYHSYLHRIEENYLKDYQIRMNDQLYDISDLVTRMLPGVKPAHLIEDIHKNKFIFKSEEPSTMITAFGKKAITDINNQAKADLIEDIFGIISRKTGQKLPKSLIEGAITYSTGIKPDNQMRQVSSEAVAKAYKEEVQKLGSFGMVIEQLLNDKRYTEPISKPAPFAPEPETDKPVKKEAGLLDISKLKGALRHLVDDKFIPIVDSLSDKISKKKDTVVSNLLNIPKKATKLVQEDKKISSQKNRKSLSGVIDYFLTNAGSYKNKNTLDNDASIVLNRLFGTETGTHSFELLCEVAIKYGSATKAEIDSLKKGIRTSEPIPKKSVPFREELNKIVRNSAFEARYEQLREQNQKYGIQPSGFSLDSYKQRIVRTKIHVDAVRTAKEEALVSEAKSREAVRLRRLRETVERRVTFERYRLINKRFLDRVLKTGEFTDKQAHDFARLLGLTNQVTKLDEREILTSALPKLQHLYDETKVSISRRLYSRPVYDKKTPEELIATASHKLGITFRTKRFQPEAEPDTFIPLADGRRLIKKGAGAYFIDDGTGSLTRGNGITDAIAYALGKFEYATQDEPVIDEEKKKATIKKKKKKTKLSEGAFLYKQKQAEDKAVQVKGDMELAKEIERQEAMEAAMRRGSAVHHIIENYYKHNRQIMITTPLEEKSNILKRALASIAYIDNKYKESDGWKIYSEQLVPGFAGLSGNHTSIDLLVINKKKGLIHIYDFKTGAIDDNYLRYQLSTEAAFLFEYIKSGMFKEAPDLKKRQEIKLFSLHPEARKHLFFHPGNKRYTFDAKVQEHKHVHLNKLKKIFNVNRWETEAGFLKAVKKYSYIDLDDPKNALFGIEAIKPFTMGMLDEFGFQPINKYGSYANKDIMAMDLETTFTDLSKTEIVSASSVRFKFDPVRINLDFAEAFERLFITQGKPDEREPSSVVHKLTNEIVTAVNKGLGVRTKFTSASDILTYMKSIQNSIQIGYNHIAFDFSVLYSELKRLSAPSKLKKNTQLFEQYFKTLTLVDMLAVMQAIGYDTREPYDFATMFNSQKQEDVFAKMTGSKPSMTHGSTIDSLVSAYIFQEALKGRHDIPRTVTALLRYLVMNPFDPVSIVNHAPDNANGKVLSYFPFALVPTSTQLLTTYPGINDRAGLGIKTVNSTAFEHYVEFLSKFDYVESSGMGAVFKEMKENVHKYILNKANDQILKPKAILDYMEIMYRRIRDDYEEDMDKFFFDRMMIAEFMQYRTQMPEKIAKEFGKWLSAEISYNWKKLKAEGVEKIPLSFLEDILTIFDKDKLMSKYGTDVLTKNAFGADDYVSHNQYAIGVQHAFIEGKMKTWIRIQKPLAYISEPTYNERGELVYDRTKGDIMAEVLNSSPTSTGPIPVIIDSKSLDAMSKLMADTLSDKWVDMMQNAETLRGNLDILNDTEKTRMLAQLSLRLHDATSPEALTEIESMAGMLFPTGSKELTGFNKVLKERREKFDDPAYRSTALYEAMRRGGFSNRAIENALSSDEFRETLDTMDLKKYSKFMQSVSHAATVKNYVNDVLGLNLSDDKWLSLMKSGDFKAMDRFMNRDYAEKHGASREPIGSLLEQAESLRRDNPFMTKGQFSYLLDASYDAETFKDAISDVKDEMSKTTAVFKNFQHVMTSIPFYDPDKLFQASYHQIGNVHHSLRGLIPSSLNTSITKFMTGAVQDYEYGWQGPKYALRRWAPAFDLLGGTIGALASAGNPMGAMVGVQAGRGLLAWTSQMVGNRAEQGINEVGLFLSSHFNKMGAVLTPAIAAINLFTKALKIASIPLMAGLGMGLYQYKKALSNMGTLDTPLSLLTGVGYGSGYAHTERLDYAFGMNRGTTNKILEDMAFAKQGLYTLGKYDKDKLVASAMLGIFRETYTNPNSTGTDNYKSIMDKMLSRVIKEGGTSGRTMYLLNQYSPELAKQVQVRYEYDRFLNGGGAGAWYKQREFNTYDLTSQDRSEFRAITFFQRSFGESIQNAMMRVAAGLYKWKGFDFMNSFTGTVTRAADYFAAGDVNAGLKEIAKGINNFIKGIGETWKDIKDKVGWRDVKDIIVDTFKTTGAQIAHTLLGYAKDILLSLEKIDGPMNAVFKGLYEKFKEFFDFVGQIRIDIDPQKFLDRKPGAISIGYGYKFDDINYGNREFVRHEASKLITVTGKEGKTYPVDAFGYLDPKGRWSSRTYKTWTQPRDYIRISTQKLDDDERAILNYFFGDNIDTYSAKGDIELPASDKNIKAMNEFLWLTDPEGHNNTLLGANWHAFFGTDYATLKDFLASYDLRFMDNSRQVEIIRDLQEKLKVNPHRDSDILDQAADISKGKILPYLKNGVDYALKNINETQGKLELIFKNANTGEERTFKSDEIERANGTMNFGSTVSMEYMGKKYALGTN